MPLWSPAASTYASALNSPLDVKTLEILLCFLHIFSTLAPHINWHSVFFTHQCASSRENLAQSPVLQLGEKTAPAYVWLLA